MNPTVIAPPPTPKTLDYPGMTAVGGGAALAILLLIVAGRFDPTGGVLTISLLIVLGFFGALSFAIHYTIPTDQETASIIGGLTAAFGAVIAYWLGRPKEPRE